MNEVMQSVFNFGLFLDQAFSLVVKLSNSLKIGIIFNNGQFIIFIEEDACNSFCIDFIGLIGRSNLFSSPFSLNRINFFDGVAFLISHCASEWPSP